LSVQYVATGSSNTSSPAASAVSAASAAKGAEVEYGWTKGVPPPRLHPGAEIDDLLALGPDRETGAPLVALGVVPGEEQRDRGGARALPMDLGRRLCTMGTGAAFRSRRRLADQLGHSTRMPISRHLNAAISEFWGHACGLNLPVLLGS
jgi:hypothetical protein